MTSMEHSLKQTCRYLSEFGLVGVLWDNVQFNSVHVTAVVLTMAQRWSHTEPITRVSKSEGLTRRSSPQRGRPVRTWRKPAADWLPVGWRGLQCAVPRYQWRRFISRAQGNQNSLQTILILNLYRYQDFYRIYQCRIYNYRLSWQDFGNTFAHLYRSKR